MLRGAEDSPLLHNRLNQRGRPRGGEGREREERRTDTRRLGLVYGDGEDLAQHMVFAFHGATRVFFYHSLFHPLLSLIPATGPATAYSQCGARRFNTISPHHIYPSTHHLYSRPRAPKPMCLPYLHPSRRPILFPVASPCAPATAPGPSMCSVAHQLHPTPDSAPARGVSSLRALRPDKLPASCESAAHARPRAS